MPRLTRTVELVGTANMPHVWQNDLWKLPASVGWLFRNTWRVANYQTWWVWTMLHMKFSSSNTILLGWEWRKNKRFYNSSLTCNGFNSSMRFIKSDFSRHPLHESPHPSKIFFNSLTFIFFKLIFFQSIGLSKKVKQHSKMYNPSHRIAVRIKELHALGAYEGISSQDATSSLYLLVSSTTFYTQHSLRAMNIRVILHFSTQ